MPPIKESASKAAPAKKTDFAVSQTRINLARAFAGETQAGARYQFLAKVAKNEQQFELEKLLKQLAHNEMAHAKIYWKHLVLLEGKQNFDIRIDAAYPYNQDVLLSGLKATYEHELSEHKTIYPAFADIAKQEGFKDIEKSFRMIAEIENCHYMMLKELHDKLSKNALLKSKESTKWKCTECGYEESGKSPWNTCPVCGYEKGYIKIPLSDTQS